MASEMQKQYRLFNGHELVELVDMPNSDSEHVVRRLNATVGQPVHPDQLSLPSPLDLQVHGVLSDIDEGDYVVWKSSVNQAKVFKVIGVRDHDGFSGDKVLRLDNLVEVLDNDVELAGPKQLKEAGIIEEIPKKALDI